MAIAEITVKADVSEIENLIDQLKDLRTYKLHQDADQTLVDLDEVVKIFADHVELEVAQPERKTGRWIEHRDYPGLAYLCSNCDYFTTLESYYCPNCGADMRGE